MRQIRAIAYGIGSMGKIATRLMVEKGVQIVGAIGHVSNIGQDLGDVAELGFRLNVPISGDERHVLDVVDADIAMVAVGRGMNDMAQIFENCLKAGLNVSTIAGEAFYPWRTAPEVTARLDRLAKAHDVTITGTGFQEAFYLGMVGALSGASHRIDVISGTHSWNVDDFGPQIAREFHVGSTLEEFESDLAHSTTSNVIRNGLETLVARLGFTVLRASYSVSPVLADADTRCQSLGIDIPKRGVIGHAERVELEADRGVRFIMSAVGQIYKPGDTDVVEWIIEGEPRLHLRSEKVPTRLATCTQWVNRIPDVVNAPAGYVTVDSFPFVTYRAFPLEWYVH